MIFDYDGLDIGDAHLLFLFLGSTDAPEFAPSGCHSFEIKESQIGQEGILRLIKRFGLPIERLANPALEKDGLWYASHTDGWDDGCFAFYFKSKRDAVEARIMI